MIYVIIFMLMVVSIGLIILINLKPTEDKPVITEKSEKLPLPPRVKPSTMTRGSGELLITNYGTEYYTRRSKLETYIKIPEIYKCDTDEAPDYCEVTDVRDKFVFEYDLDKPSGGSFYTKCSDGSHDCWYVEQYDDEGTLIGIVDKDGVSMLDVMADDLWSDKWDLENAELVKQTVKTVEYKDDKLVAKKEFRGLKIGDTVTVNDIEPAIYFAGLLTSMKLAGLEKPEKITLKIKGAKSNYEKFKKVRMG